MSSPSYNHPKRRERLCPNPPKRLRAERSHRRRGLVGLVAQSSPFFPQPRVTASPLPSNHLPRVWTVSPFRHHSMAGPQGQGGAEPREEHCDEHTHTPNPSPGPGLGEPSPILCARTDAQSPDMVGAHNTQPRSVQGERGRTDIHSTNPHPLPSSPMPIKID